MEIMPIQDLIESLEKVKGTTLLMVITLKAYTGLIQHLLLLTETCLFPWEES